MTEEQARPAKPRARGLKISVFILLFLLLGALAGGAYWFWAYQKAVSNNPVEERRQLVQVLGASVILPNEEPQIATVQDAKKLSNPLLASKAQDGDKLLVFNIAKRIYIYRPAQKKLVDILTIQTDEPLNQ